MSTIDFTFFGTALIAIVLAFFVVCVLKFARWIVRSIRGV